MSLVEVLKRGDPLLMMWGNKSSLGVVVMIFEYVKVLVLECLWILAKRRLPYFLTGATKHPCLFARNNT